jgi:hypothetical protein
MYPDSAQEQPDKFSRFGSAAARALAPLVDEWRENPDWPAVLVAAPLLIYDVLRQLDVSPAEIAAVLGDAGAAAVATWLDGQPCSRSAPDDDPSHSQEAS